MTVLLVLTLMAGVLALTIHVADTRRGLVATLCDLRVIAAHLTFYLVAGDMTPWPAVLLMAVLVWAVALGVVFGDRPAATTPPTTSPTTTSGQALPVRG